MGVPASFIEFRVYTGVVEPYRSKRPMAPIWSLLHPERIPSILLHGPAHTKRRNLAAFCLARSAPSERSWLQRHGQGHRSSRARKRRRVNLPRDHQIAGHRNEIQQVHPGVQRHPSRENKSGRAVLPRPRQENGRKRPNARRKPIRPSAQEIISGPN